MLCGVVWCCAVLCNVCVVEGGVPHSLLPSFPPSFFFPAPSSSSSSSSSFPWIVGADVYKATCTMVAAGDADVSGTVEITQAGGPGTDVTISGTISNIPDGPHAFHVHTYGDVTALSGKGTGGHWNPFNVSHACYPSAVRHAGDIGVLDFVSGTYTFPGGYTRDLIELSGPNSVIGRGLVLHALNDSCTGASGNAGARLAQCTLGLATPGADTQVGGYQNLPASRNATWAVAALKEVTGGATTVSGSVWFRNMESGDVRVFVRLSTGATVESYHGIHVHAYGDISDPAGGNTGGHYNPANVDHGWPMGTRHMGDMGNVTAVAATGNIVATKTLNLLNMGSDVNNIIGRGVVLHSGPDDGGQPTGNAGPKLAMGPIGVSNGPPAQVVAVIKGTSNAPTVAGTIYFSQPHGPGTDVTITGSIAGMTPGQHAMHVHMYGDVTSRDGTTAGGHYNPDGKTHGCSPSLDRHAGDIGTITVESDGTYTFPADFTRDLIDLSGPRSVVGRAVVFHETFDSCMGTAGDAGSRLAYGTIGIASVEELNMNGAFNGEDSPPSNYRAVAVLQSIQDPVNTGFAGTIYFERTDTGLRVYGIVDGLIAQSVHGLHVHANGDLTSATGANVGGHYNPLGVPHGLPSETPSHYGDLGNFAVYKDGRAYISLFFEGDKALAGFDSIIGRSVVIHSGSDQGQAEQPTGGAGSKVAAGVIGICGVNCWPATLLQQPVDGGTEISPWTWVILAGIILCCVISLMIIFCVYKKQKSGGGGGGKLDFI